MLSTVLIEPLVRRRERNARWIAFSCWALSGFLSALAAISFAIGLLVLPLALIAIVGASRLSVWPAGLGFISGAGLIGVFVSVMSLDDESGHAYNSWLIISLITIAASVAAFVAVRSTKESPR